MLNFLGYLSCPGEQVKAALAAVSAPRSRTSTRAQPCRSSQRRPVSNSCARSVGSSRPTRRAAWRRQPPKLSVDASRPVNLSPPLAYLFSRVSVVVGGEVAAGAVDLAAVQSCRCVRRGAEGDHGL